MLLADDLGWKDIGCYDGPVKTPTLDRLAAVYSGTIDNTDRAISRLLDKLKEADSLENTLVFYTSDNGSYRNDRNGNLRGRKASNFEGGIRVPGIFYWPGTIKDGHVEHEPAGVVDLLPTVCGLLGIDKPEGVHLDGSVISPLLTGHSNEFARHQPLYWHLPSTNPSLAIRDGNYSMVAYRDYEFPRDRAAIAQVEKDIEEVLRRRHRRFPRGAQTPRVFCPCCSSQLSWAHAILNRSHSIPGNRTLGTPGSNC